MWSRRLPAARRRGCPSSPPPAQSCASPAGPPPSRTRRTPRAACATYAAAAPRGASPGRAPRAAHRTGVAGAARTPAPGGRTSPAQRPPRPRTWRRRGRGCGSRAPAACVGPPRFCLRSAHPAVTSSRPLRRAAFRRPGDHTAGCPCPGPPLLRRRVLFPAFGAYPLQDDPQRHGRASQSRTFGHGV